MKVYIVRQQGAYDQLSVVHVASTEQKAQAFIDNKVHDQERRYVQYNKASIEKYMTAEEAAQESVRRMSNARMDYVIDDFVVDSI